MAPYIIWDWNGTLLDDVDAAVYALNQMLAARGLPRRVERGFYRAHFGFPVRPFYALLGMAPDAEWDRICEDFHRHIADGPQRVRAESAPALSLARSLGIGQSILSALRQDLLLRDTAAAGLQPFFDEIYGVDNLDGASKLDRGVALVARLRERGLLPASRRLFFVGDTMHDSEVASALGAEAVLVDGGHQTAERLARSRRSVVPSLSDAVRLIAATADPSA